MPKSWVKNIRGWSLTVAVLLGATSAFVAPEQSAIASTSPPRLGAQGDPVFDGAWSQLSISGSGPNSNYGQVAIYDPDNDRMVVAGGQIASGESWALVFSPSPKWVQLTSAQSGIPTDNAIAVYDPLRKRMLMFGGSNTNDVWALNLTATPYWSHVTVNGAPPGARLYATAIYDPVRDRMVIFGGWDGSVGSAFTDTWELTNLAGTPNWNQLHPTGTASTAGLGQTAVYDPVGDRMVVYGGYAGHLWSLNLSGSPQWTQLADDPQFPPPTPRGHGASIYEPTNHRMVLFGGYPGQRTNEVWAAQFDYSPPRWVQLVPTGTPPAPTDVLTAVFRGLTNQMLVYGGIQSTPGVSALTWAVPGPPVISEFIPLGGQVGNSVHVTGSSLGNATDVKFNGVSSTITAASSTDLYTVVPAGATTGPITITNPIGTTTSAQSFFVGEMPIVSSATPQSGKIGQSIVLAGQHFTAATRVAFGPSSHAPFTVDSDLQITAFVDTAAVTGPISVTTLAATGASAFTFTVIPPDSAPEMYSVRDVPNDQGGHVMVKWLRSDVDLPQTHLITGYRVWRRAPAGAIADANRMILKRVGPDGVTEEFWEALATLPAAFLSGYAYDAGTTQDSLPDSNPYSAFFVQALTSNSLVFYNSAVDSGYSVDNLSPAVPQAVAGSFGANGVALHWKSNREADLKGYRVYRGANDGFQPGPGNLIATPADTGYFDPSGDLSSYYKLAAVDIHGNQSRYALIAPQFATSALASLVSADARPGSADLVWYSASPGLAATLYRRTPSSDWSALATLTASGDGLMSYHDAAVSNGIQYGYRLGIWDTGEESFVGETWITIPFPELSLAGVVPNPSVGRAVWVEFQLPNDAPATLRLYDIEGRTITTREVGALGPGSHRLDLSTGVSLAPGVYLVRLEQGHESATARAAIVR